MLCDMTIVSHTNLTNDIYECVLEGELAENVKAPGQLIMMKADGLFLRRPISICDLDILRSRLTIVYKVVGEGTRVLSELKVSKRVSCLGPFGNGFDIENKFDDKLIALVGGGVGAAPLYILLKRLKAKRPNINIVTVLGFARVSDIFYECQFKQESKTLITTDDGSYGVCGNPITAMQSINPDYIFTCGPMIMMKSLKDNFPKSVVQASLEERMACGFGVCMCCSCSDSLGYKRVCKDGPVFEIGEEVEL